VTDLKLFVNGTWYGDLYKDEIMAATGFNESQYTDFYATGSSNNDSFGNLILNITLNTAQHF
jgi:hypothetical protein